MQQMSHFSHTFTPLLEDSGRNWRHLLNHLSNYGRIETFLRIWKVAVIDCCVVMRWMPLAHRRPEAPLFANNLETTRLHHLIEFIHTSLVNLCSVCLCIVVSVG